PRAAPERRRPDLRNAERRHGLRRVRRARREAGRVEERERSLVEDQYGESAEDESRDEPHRALRHRCRAMTKQASSHGEPPSRVLFDGLLPAIAVLSRSDYAPRRYKSG